MEAVNAEWSVFKREQEGPDWLGSVGWASSAKPKVSGLTAQDWVAGPAPA